MTLLKKFGIPLDKPLENYNLIGIDFGDGEISAATVEQDALSGKLAVKGLSLQESGMHYKNVNAFYISASNISLVYDVKEKQVDEGRRYYNYKKCPQDDVANSNYILDDTDTAGITYRELMVTCFNCLVNTLFESNVYLISREKPTILLVGRPSSPGWAASELEYAKMLQDGLKLPANQKPVYVAIQSESTAALAREIDPKWDTQRVKKGEIVVVLDNGSSTFDITVIGIGGVVGEGSYQFGGNLLDENLLKLMKQTVAKENPGMELASIHGHKLGLRMVKEAYYGLKGTSQQSQLYDVDLYGKQGKRKYQFLLDEAAMNTALTGMAVQTFKFKTNLAGQTDKAAPVTYHSWLDACKGIYESFYKEMKKHFRKQGTDASHPVVPDRIILSGGVSVMPEVQKAVGEAFGVKPRLTERPNYSVSEGLAYVLGTEMQKKQFLEDLTAELDKMLPSTGSLKVKICDAGVDEEWRSFKGAMEEWKNSPKSLSLKDYDNLWKNKYFQKLLGNCVQDGAERWYQQEGVEDLLTAMLEAHFKTLFPEYVDQFKAKLPKLDFSKLPSVEVSISYSYNFFFGVDNLTDGDLTVPRDAAWRKKAYDHFCNSQNKIRTGGELKFTHVVQVKRGFGPFKRMVNQTTTTVTKYDGIRSLYEKGLTDSFVNSVRSQICLLLHKPLEDYVESITPYFNMTARQKMGNKT